MDRCAACDRSWIMIQKKDRVRTKFTVNSSSMAEYFSEQKAAPVSLGSQVCKKCQGKFHFTNLYVRRRPSSTGRMSVDEPEAGPSELRSTVIEEVIAEEEDDYIKNLLGDQPFTPRATRFRGSRLEVDQGTSEQDWATRELEAIDNRFEDDYSQLYGDTSDATYYPDDSDDSDTESSDYSNDSQPVYRLSICGHGSCIYGCHIAFPDRPVSVPKKIRIAILTIFHVFVPKDARWCHTHVDLIREPKISDISPTIEHLEDALTLMIGHTQKASHITVPPYDAGDVNRIQEITNLSPDNFNDLATHITGSKDPRTYLAAFLYRLKTGLPYKEVGMIFGINRKTLSRQCKIIADQLTKNFVPLNLGFHHLPERRQTYQHNTYLTNKLLLTPRQNSEMAKITIWDGTYLYCQRSMNISVQKKLYSGQKKTHLFKPMMIVFPDGYIYEVFCFNNGSSNDALIMKDILERSTECQGVFAERDTFILDRGFRDVVKWLQDRGHVVFTPSLSKGREQLSWQEANNTRRVTMTRWVVEAVIGRLKTQFRLLHRIIENTAIPAKREELKICCALVNKYGKRFISHKGWERVAVDRISLRAGIPHRLADVIVCHNLHMKHSWFKNISHGSASSLAPRLDHKDLTILATGTYSIKYINAYKTAAKQARLQTSLQVLKEDVTSINFSDFGIDATEPRLVRIRLPSRHKSTEYRVYMVLDMDKEGINRIAEWWCKCFSGLRTTNPCGHVITAISILAFGFESITPAQNLVNIFDQDIHDSCSDTDET